MSGRGSVRGAVTAFVALGCCLLAAPTAHADFDDLLDTVLGAAAAGADLGPGEIPADPGDLGDLGVLQDPLGQLDQLFHETPGSVDADPAYGAPDSPAHGAPDSPGDGGYGAPSGTTPGGAEHNSEGEGSERLPSLPKFSIPSTGNGSGGSGGSGGGSGGSGNSGSSAPRTKANAGATNGSTAPTPEPAAVP
ncbi:hypothetical protein MTER_36730 [Mycolicibacter terrae]|uniref:Uncharacterized protein n=1 Tax=Mycolicibacter terrae TaxID=1788 RepID=A0AAD1HZ22_9MYCO|nr:hypothetical protein [Mycolicibacter terrae]BBX24262.1 hypothetical protein MTER_36730 [Mycolicibacter terrae]SNV54816.1 Uncharacterised protein [Mycolicibacter terrae]